MIVLEQQKSVLEWLGKHIPMDGIGAARGPYHVKEWEDAIGFENDADGAVGAVAYHSLTPHSVCMVAAGTGNWLTRLRIEAAFYYPFHILDVDHIAAQTVRSNRKARKLLERLGFKLEGVLRRASPIGQDVFVYGMTKSECRWVNDDGNIQRAEAA